MPHARAADDARIYYELHGEDTAPPLVLIRGTGADGTRWMPQVEAYAPHFRCLIFDGRGVGRSDTTPPPYTVAQMADDTLAVMDEAGIGAAHVSGSSLGGAIGLYIAANHDQRVLTLQLHSSWLVTRGFSRYSLGLLAKLLEAGGTEFYYEATLPLLFSAGYMSRHFDALMSLLDHMRSNSASYDGLLGQIGANLSYDMSGDVDRVVAPTLVTVGELDAILPVVCSEELRDAIPGSRLVVFPSAGHLASLEAPADFNRVTLDWLLAQTAQSAP